MVEYSLTILIIFIRDVLGFCTKSNISSAYREILLVVLFDKIPEILSFCIIAAARGSMNKAKSNGDKGHPRQVLHLSWNADDMMPFIITDTNDVLIF